MKISKHQFLSIGSHLKISKEQLETLWTHLEKQEAAQDATPFARYLLYFGQ